jgi:hypothetical protein
VNVRQEEGRYIVPRGEKAWLKPGRFLRWLEGELAPCPNKLVAFRAGNWYCRFAFVALVSPLIVKRSRVKLAAFFLCPHGGNKEAQLKTAGARVSGFVLTNPDRKKSFFLHPIASVSGAPNSFFNEKSITK